MELVCKKRFEDKVGATFTLNKKYKFQFESGFGYYTIDDNKKVLFMNKDVIFEHFTSISD